MSSPPWHPNIITRKKCENRHSTKMSTQQQHVDKLSSYLKSHKLSDDTADKSRPSSSQRQMISRGASGGTGKAQTARTGSPARRPGDTSVNTTKTSTLRMHLAKKLCIQNMPDEILLRVFSFLNAGALLLAATVCKKWYSLAHDNFIWRLQYRIHVELGGLDKLEKKEPHVPPDGQLAPGYWQKQAISRLVAARNNRIPKIVKSRNPNTCMPVHLQQGITAIGTKWYVCLVEGNNRKEHNFAANDAIYSKFSHSLRWYDLSFPPIRSIRYIRLYGVTPVFYGRDGLGSKNCPRTRSLMQTIELSWSQLQDRTPDVQDDLVNVYFMEEGFIVAVWKDGGELAFINCIVHNHHLLQRSVLGSSTTCYPHMVHGHQRDELSKHPGLSRYDCLVSLRNHRKVFLEEYEVSAYTTRDKVANGFASFEVLKDWNAADKEFYLRWKTELFKGELKDAFIVDTVMMDDNRQVFWTLCAPTKLVKMELAEVRALVKSGQIWGGTNLPFLFRRPKDPRSFDAGENCWSFEAANSLGKVTGKVIWDEERERYQVFQVYFHIATKLINMVFGTNYD
ncbi:PREDICTED: F-box only protein 15-like isoform X2 [Branchiostoma belcheri]|uniref:F-box only protein 15-like isoform X2 n=1 Tax=Branchiostoma belcheri TaxID=7741 RepID=A0A6P4Z544_BRABE|nr:PREDICTED: F-box only protein 15-like isoform X2 [Branchiostoma belcheri]